MNIRYPEFNLNSYKRYIREQKSIDDEYNRHISQIFCNNDIEHQKRQNTHVKFLLLDKTYSAGLRRWVHGACDIDPTTFIMDYVFDGQRVRIFRRILRQATDLGDKLQKGNLKGVTKLHSEFVSVLQGTIRDDTEMKSFCSKYLYFHSGIFPLFDTYARKGLCCIMGRRRRKQLGHGDIHFKVYKNYVGEFWNFLTFLHKKDSKCGFDRQEIKDADNYLMWVGQDRQRLGKLK